MTQEIDQALICKSCKHHSKDHDKNSWVGDKCNIEYCRCPIFLAMWSTW